MRRHLQLWLVCMRFGRGLAHFIGWDLVAALALTHPALLIRQRGSVAFGAEGEMAMAAGGRHEVVTGLADGCAARREVLRSLGSGLSSNGLP